MLRAVSYAILSIYLFSTFFPLYYINKSLKPYQTEVLNIVKQHCKPGQFNDPPHKSIYFNLLEKDTIGICLLKPFEYIIQVDPRFWLNASDDEKWELIFHESAHCLLFKDHVNNPRNYMFFSLANLPRNIVEQQFIEDLEEHCHE